ncbi:MAG: hypothetical protein ACT4ON_08970 [Bacteroidota bacterium]
MKQRPSFLIKLDSRNSFISNSRARILGAKLALNYGGRLHFGLGYNQLYAPAKDFDQQVYYGNFFGIRDSVTAKLHLFYISAYAEYIFYQNKHWELSMPLQIGVGKTYYTYHLYGQKREREENLNFIYEPAVSVGYKFVKWFGVGADIGFRFMVTGDKKVIQKFTSPTYAFKILIFYNEIYKSLFKKDKSE